MGPKRFQSQNFSLFIVKFKKLGFSALFSHQNRRLRGAGGKDPPTLGDF